jgi:hypothetical protein
MQRLALALVLLASGCRARGGVAGRFAVPLTADAPPGDEVVATVDGHPIRASEIALQAQARGVDAKAALADLIDAEVLAAEAARRGIDRDRDAVDAAKAAAVRRLLSTGFERDTTADQIPIRDLKRVYQMNSNLLDHSEYVDVWHLLVPVKKGATPAERAACRAVADELERKARGVASVEAFKALATEVKPPPGVEVRTEQIVTARDGWVLTSFSYPAFDQLKKPGDTSSVVETDYGYHVIYLVKRIPPAHVPLEEAAPKLRAGLLPEFQRHEFAKLVDALAAEHHTVVHYDRLP